MLNIIVTLKCGLKYRSLKVIESDTIESLGMLSYSPSIVTMAVSLAISDIQHQKMA